MFQVFIFMFNCFLRVTIIQISANVDRLHLLVSVSLEITGTVVVHMGPVSKLSHHFCHPWWRCERNDEDVRWDKIYQQDNDGRAEGHRVMQAMFLWSFSSTELIKDFAGYFGGLFSRQHPQLSTVALSGFSVFQFVILSRLSSGDWSCH